MDLHQSKVIVEIDGQVEYEQTIGQGRELAENLMCGKEQLPLVLEALDNSAAHCRLHASSLNDTNRMGDVGSSPA